MLTLAAHVDAAGDGWIEIFLPKASSAPIAGFWAELQACAPGRTVPEDCSDVAVFGGSRGAAEAAGLMVAAGHAFVHGVFGTCPTQHCTPMAADGALLTSLSVSIPRLGPGTTVCIISGALSFAAGPEDESASPSGSLHRACAVPLPPLGAAASEFSQASPARGVAFVKTYKTGSSTLGSLLHRYADSHGLDVAVNAKALKWAKPLEARLLKGTMAKPTECLFEFHRFQRCGKAWLDAQAAAGATPKPLQLVVDHSRLQPLDELARGGAPAANAPGCSDFLRQMREADGVAHALFGQPAAVESLRRCTVALSMQARGTTGGGACAGCELKAVEAYREAIPGGLLVTAMRWPVARFTSALEQFNMPQQTGVPCSRTRAKQGGVCHGHTCERGETGGGW